MRVRFGYLNVDCEAHDLSVDDPPSSTIVNHYKIASSGNTGSYLMCSDCAELEKVKDLDYHWLRDRMGIASSRYEPIIVPRQSEEMDIAIECALFRLAGL